MSKANKDFIPLLSPQESRRPTAFSGPAQAVNLLRDQLTISSWLCLGAIVQGLAFLVVGRTSLLPAVLVLSLRFVDHLLMTVGLTRDRYMDAVLLKKFSAQFPDEQGRYGSKPADSEIVVFMIGTRCNHPLGLLAPGFKTINQYFASVEKDLVAHGDEFGMLGMRLCLDAAERSTASEIVVICYFRTLEQLHAFAHSPYHRKGWDWWIRTAKEIPHISIYHETYHIPAGHWENIYLNSHPSGITASTTKYFDQERGMEMWASPVVDASKGLLRSSAGRMSRSEGKEHDEYGHYY